MMKFLNIVFVGIFFALLWAPLLKSLNSHAEMNLTEENRKRHPAPVIRPTLDSVKSYPTNFDAYYQDVFGFRERLIKKNQRTRMHFGMSISENVIKGKDSWYFYAGDESVNDFRGLLPYSEIQLEHFRLALEEKQAWLHKQGIAYVYVLTPDKHSIYSEYMSDKYPKMSPYTRADQIAAYLRGDTEANYLDLRQPLLEAKKEQRLYHKVDTHWNDLGAYVGYREIVNNLRNFFPWMEPTPREQFQLARKMVRSGDLGLLMGRQNEIQEEYLYLIPRFKQCATREPYSVESLKGQPVADILAFATSCPSQRLTALVFRDSFTVALQPFLSENFNKVIYISKPFNNPDAVEIITREKPDVVIEQHVERHVEISDEIALYTEARYKDTFSEYAAVLVTATKPSALISQKGIEILQSSHDIDVVTDSQNSQFSVYSADGRPLMMRIVMEAPSDTFMRVRYKIRTADNKVTDEARDIAITAGHNDVYVDMRAFPVQGDINITPGIDPGHYLIESITLRG